jgi:hypothetical protein
MREHPIQADIQLELGSRRDVRLFRNNVGVAWQGEKISLKLGVLILRAVRAIRFGLFVGSGDLIGWKSITVTPDMVGRRVAVFLSVETKAARGVKSTEQETWRDNVVAAGGLAGFARSVDEAKRIVDTSLDK